MKPLAKKNFYIFIFIISLFFTQTVYGENLNNTLTPVTLSIPDPFPLRKAQEEKIQEQWFFWGKIIKKMEDSSSGLPPLQEQETLLMREFDTESNLLKIMKSPSTENIKELQRFVTHLESTKSETLKKMADILAFGLQEYDTISQTFFSNTKIYKGLSENDTPENMVAYWLRYSHIYAYNPEILSPLFTLNYKEKIVNYPFKKQPVFKNIFNELYTLFKLYYHSDLKYSKNDQHAFDVAKKIYGANMIVVNKTTRIFSKNGFSIMIWKLEDGAWRLDQVNLQKE